MASGRSKKRRTPPSRLRYEASHPTVTVRVSRELYDQLQTLRNEANFSYAEILKTGLDKLEPTAEEAYQRGFQDGQEQGGRKRHGDGIKKGWDWAVGMFEVRYYCSRCGRKHLAITTDAEKASAAEAMYDAGWHDPECEE